MSATAVGATRAPRHRARRVRLVAAVLALVVIAAACDAKAGDFTGDGHADQVYLNTQTGVWFTAGSSTPLFSGQPGDIPVAGDYDGDLKWEPAVLRGTTWISSALSDPIVYDPPGMPAGPVPIPGPLGSPPPTLLPVPGDYDGTGKTVPAYYDEVDASWWIMGHSGSVQFGIPPTAGGTVGYDVPVPADYDGDGKTDIAIYRPTDGTFHYLSSKTGQEVVLASPAPSGPITTNLPVPGDYDGVGHAEAAVTNGSLEDWYVAGHTGSIASFPNDGHDNYIPAPGDYNGDGKVEPAAIDSNNGQFWLGGQPRPPETTGTEALTTFAAAIDPPGSLEGYNYIRLIIFGQCVLAQSTNQPCPGGV
jgi:hypothetical protein